jgi:predicted peptidase
MVAMHQPTACRIAVFAGGFGTWTLITKKPGVFASAIIRYGGGIPDLARNVKDMPISAFQGDADGARISDYILRLTNTLRARPANKSDRCQACD